MRDFFISYNRADKGWAEWIAWQLEDAGYTTVIQAWDFRPGSNFVLEMQKAATEAQRTIAVLSPDYLKSLYTQPEWAAAFAQDPTGKDKTLVPVRVRECELKGLLPQIIYVDLVGFDETAAKTALLAGVQKERAKPKTSPKFPGSSSPLATPPHFPGGRPSSLNILFHRNPNFTNGDELVSDLRTAVSKDNAVLMQTQAVRGLVGLGKMQLGIPSMYAKPTLLLFIHGLGGHSRKTWGQFPALVLQDEDLRAAFHLDFYSYPTALFRIPFFGETPKIQTLAAGLRTQINNRFTQYESIILVCHSLGGPVARHYLTEEIKRGRTPKAYKLMLYAVPNNGAALASVAKYVSWRHHQISQ